MEDALEVVDDEAGSERWKRKQQELAEVNAKIEKLQNQINDINQKIADAEAMVMINNNVDATMSTPIMDATSDELPF